MELLASPPGRSDPSLPQSGFDNTTHISVTGWGWLGHRKSHPNLIRPFAIPTLVGNISHATWALIFLQLHN